MKKIYLALIMLSVLSIFNAMSQNAPSDKILGIWLSENKDGKIEIYKSENKYFGKLIWGKTMYEADGATSKKDAKNKNEKLRSRNLKDLPMLKNFTYSDGVWDGGEIYDPFSGKNLQLHDENLRWKAEYQGIYRHLPPWKNRCLGKG